jgi:valyl-tRNA synthetase
MVFGPDGNKMSKSRGNVVTPEEAIEEYGADAVRQALALGGQPGADVQFQPKEATSASRFNTKVWNITKFAAGHVEDGTADVSDPAYRDADRWILARARQTADRVDEAMAEYRYDTALREVREFVWHDLADDYLELVKGRLYEGRPGERNAARHALLTALSSGLRLLAPFAPVLAEEAYDALPGVEGSVHAADWPDLPSFDGAVVERGQLVADVASEVRSWKSDQGMALNADLDRIEVYADLEGEAALDTYDLSGAVNAPVYLEAGRPNVELVPVGVDPDHASIGPEFRDEAGAVIGALESADPAALKAQQETNGEVELDVGGEVVVLDADAFEVLEEQRSASGEEVEVVELDDATVLIYEG